ncbi:MAG: hypothetical protein WCE51_15610, partial [Chthoniobacterales bacterium]
ALPHRDSDTTLVLAGIYQCSASELTIGVNQVFLLNCRTATTQPTPIETLKLTPGHAVEHRRSRYNPAHPCNWLPAPG